MGQVFGSTLASIAASCGEFEASLAPRSRRRGRRAEGRDAGIGPGASRVVSGDERPRADLRGTGEPGAVVRLAAQGRQATVASNGTYVLTGVTLAEGANTLALTTRVHRRPGCLRASRAPSRRSRSV